MYTSWTLSAKSPNRLTLADCFEPDYDRRRGGIIQALRNADVRASPAETLDAFDVLSRAGIENKTQVKDALSLVRFTRPNQRATI